MPVRAAFHTAIEKAPPERGQVSVPTSKSSYFACPPDCSAPAFGLLFCGACGAD
jgi:hypothetical protein